MALTDMENEAILAELVKTLPAMDPAIAGAILLEAKGILDELGVTFYLRDGICLGAIREGGIIPWDDDIDLGTTFGLHGFSEAMIEPIITAFREADYYVKREEFDTHVYLGMLKNRHMMSLTFFRPIKGRVHIYPGVVLPVRLFDQLKEIDFLGTKFRVPNPPEEYLQLKYGPDWRTPKHIGYEKDVVDNIGPGPTPGLLLQIRRWASGMLFPGGAARLQVLDQEGVPVPGAEVVVAGHGRFVTNAKGVAKLYLPIDHYYAVAIRFREFEEVLYMELLGPGHEHLYQPDPSTPAGRVSVITKKEPTPN